MSKKSANLGHGESARKVENAKSPGAFSLGWAVLRQPSVLGHSGRLFGVNQHCRWLMPRWVSSASVAQVPEPIDKRGDQHSEAQNCSATLQIMGNRADVGSMLAKIKPCQRP
jgi:hypothetical protein